MYRLLLFITLCCVGSGCYDSSYDEAEAPSDYPAPTTTIAELCRLHQGGTTRIDHPLVVKGRITANTDGGNFYRSLLLESEGAAVEILVGLDALHSDYPIGCEVVAVAEGLAIQRSYGIVQLGRATAAQEVTYIGSQAAIDRHLYRTDAPRIHPEATEIATTQLTPTMAGCLVRIEGLQHTPEEPVELHWSGYQRFTDTDGAEIYTYVRSYADLADEAPPIGRCTLTGILQYDSNGEGRYILKLRDENDVE